MKEIITALLLFLTCIHISVSYCPYTPTCSTGELGALKAYPDDCYKYNYCNEKGEEELSVCPSGQRFDAAISDCMKDDLATCMQCRAILPCEPTPTCTINESGVNKPYPEDCTKYIYCNSQGQAEISVCETGKHFSPSELICLDPAVANCPICEKVVTTPAPSGTTCPPIPTCTPAEEGNLKPYPPNCRFYIYCDGGAGAVSVCPEGQEFSPELLYCTTPTEANCPQCDVSTTPSPTTGSTVLLPCDPIPTCTIADEGQLKPYPEDCTKYIYCDETGQALISSCPTGLEFSSDLLTCVDPGSSTCVVCLVPTTTTAIPVCPEVYTCGQNDTGNRQPYPPDCTKYIYCYGFENSTIRSCTLGRHFSPINLQCMSPATANCVFCEAATTITSTPSSTTTEAPCPDTPTCEFAEIGSLLPLASNCSAYVYCDGSVNGIVSYCPSGQHYDPINEKCIPASSSACVECFPETTPDPTTSPPPTTTPPSTIGLCAAVEPCSISDAGATKPYPPDCNKYIYCNENGEGEFSQCAEGLHFSPTELKCLQPEDAQCPICEETTVIISTTTDIPVTTIGICEPDPLCNVFENGVQKPYPTDCKKYIYCDFGAEKVRTCPTGQEFDPIQATCVPEANSTCALCLLETTTVIYQCDPTPECLAADEGLFKPYPPDCTRYIYCMNETATLRKCAPGNEFSPTELRCMPAEEANCIFCYPQTTSTADVTTPEPTIPLCTDPVECTIETVGHLVAVPENCTQFIYCNENGVGEPSQCKPGTYFNELTQSCVTTSDHCTVCSLPTTITSTTVEPTIPPCPEPPTCDTLSEGTQLPVPGKCSEYIYCGPNGEEEYSICEPGEAFDIDYMNCRNESEANCPECLLPTTTPIITTTTEEATTLGECPPTPTCAIGEYGEKKPYPPDCRYYVYCTGFDTDTKLRVCPTGYLFDTTALECMMANETTCLRCNLPTTTTEEPTTTIYYCPEMEPCVAGVNDYLFLPVPQNCSLYYFCDPALVSGYQVRKCAAGTLFDQVLFRCVNVTTAYCPACVLTTEVDIISLSPYPSCAPQPTCPLLGTGGLISYPPDCTKYYYCDAGNGDMMSCNPGMHFSPTSSICMPIADANCPLCSP